MRTAASILIVTLTTSLTNAHATLKHRDYRAVTVPAETAQSAPFLNAIPPIAVRTPNHCTRYEHRDHEELPVGTRIYYVNGSETIVEPGRRGPTNQTPDVVIVSDESVTPNLRR